MEGKELQTFESPKPIDQLLNNFVNKGRLYKLT